MRNMHLGSLLVTASGIFLGASGAYMIIAPESWYLLVPGVTATGPFNSHFVIDVALAYLVSAIGLVTAGVIANRTLALQAASWPVAHALFHVLLWGHHGVPHGLAFIAESVAVLALGAIAGWGAWIIPKSPD